MMRAWACVLLLAVSSSSAYAQDEGAPEEAPITKLPKLKVSAEAIYPERAMAARIEARVGLEIDIDATGRVENAIVALTTTVAREGGAELVLSATVSDPLGFGAAAIEAAKRLEFEPAEAGEGHPVPVRIGYSFNFTLPEEVATTEVDTATAADVVKNPGIVSMRGVIRERGTRARLPGALVTLFQGEGNEAHGFESTTDSQGEFEFRDLDVGEWRVLAELDSYYPFRTTETVTRGEVVEVTYYVEKGTYNAYDVLVEAPRPKKEVTRRTLSVKEAITVPGTLGDPILVVENLPGVARATPGLLIVRGSGPEDTDIYIDGVSVPLIYHFGGLRSVLPAEMLENIDFYPGNFSTFYGRATGGVLDASTTRPKPDQIHGSLDVSLLDTSVYLEIPLGDRGAIAIAGRRSYIDVVLNAVIPDDANVTLSTAPRYYDYQLLARYEVADGHELKLFLFGSDDALELLFSNPGDLSPQLQAGRLTTSTGFNRAVLEYRITQERFSNIFRTAFGRDLVGFSLGSQFNFSLDQLLVEARDRATYKFNDNFSLSGGIDMQIPIVDFSIRLSRPPKEGDTTFTDDPEVIVANGENEGGLNLAPFIEAEIDVGRLSLVPGLRFDYFFPVKGVSLDPRLVGRYTLDDQWVVKGGIGLVHQEPSPDELDEGFGNPDLELERSLQFSAGAEYRPFKFLSVDATLFYKSLDNLVSRSDASELRDGQVVPLIYDNEGSGRIFGMELYVRHELSNNLRGWVTYTLMRAERTDSGDTTSRLFDYDQTHIFALVASYLLPENWEVGIRWRVVSGSPTTPVLGGVFLSDGDEYSQVPGPSNSARLPLFHQLDIRVDKRWVFDVWQLSAYFSLVNSYNRPNVEGFSYNFDFSSSSPAEGLPVLPILGIKAEI